MTRKRTSTVRQALILAFAAGALTGAASTLTLRRCRHDSGIPAEDARGPLMASGVGGPLGETTLPSLEARFDAPPQGSVNVPAAERAI
ncbi:hypothetical protein OOK41_15100 [Micromonospora sp. NBC_01655]|uniref:hypothetical protein n=1 Tax=Micromonospora sp. NBC_01655 TaxID=2975983 RepID=UPI00224EE97B|nr:hypothetical protein [Micromonospora sp. NBC_01655]MCX4471612.1 hypothetical protein [Micromonospora sp. NBC_01655]